MKEVKVLSIEYDGQIYDLRQAIKTEPQPIITIEHNKIAVRKQKMKRCSQCNTTKPITEFNNRSKSKDGHYSWCKDCTAKKQKEYVNKKKSKIVTVKKKCNRCNIIKPIDDFALRTESADGHQGMCKACSRQYSKVRKVTRKEILNEPIVNEEIKQTPETKISNGQQFPLVDSSTVLETQVDEKIKKLNLFGPKEE